MHFAHAQGRSYTGMAISCADLISICRMHFPGRVISPQGSAGGWHESRQPQSHPHHPRLPPDSHPAFSGQSLARQQDAADPAALPDYTHESGRRLAVRVQSRTASAFLSFLPSFFFWFSLAQLCLWKFSETVLKCKLPHTEKFIKRKEVRRGFDTESWNNEAFLCLVGGSQTNCEILLAVKTPKAEYNTC